VFFATHFGAVALLTYLLMIIYKMPYFGFSATVLSVSSTSAWSGSTPVVGNRLSEWGMKCKKEP
jgi:hypothetical protein